MTSAGPGATPIPSPRPVVVVVLTYRRTDELLALVPRLREQTAAGGRSSRVLVVDNSPEAEARAAVTGLGEPSVHYVHEPRPGIASARNRALNEAAEDELLVFIDDDETPRPGWLPSLLRLHQTTGAAGIVGPVESSYAEPPSAWVHAGRFFDRRQLPTGTDVRVAATNNLLLDMRQVRLTGVTFDEAFGLSGGSDTLFTRHLVRQGGRLVWCAEAAVIDHVPVSRLSGRWVLQKSLRSGNSWSRTTLVLSSSRMARLRNRCQLAASGGARLLVGAARAGFGVLRSNDGHSARGARTAARGLGMLLGALGYTYVEYKRPAMRGRGRRGRAPS